MVLREWVALIRRIDFCHIDFSFDWVASYIEASLLFAFMRLFRDTTSRGDAGTAARNQYC